MSAEKVLGLIKDQQVKFVDYRFVDTRGKEQHVTVPAHTVSEDTFQEGKMLDGSSICGWKGINESAMILMPDSETAVIDPFYEETTLVLRCDIVEPTTMQGYSRDPRSIAKRAEAYMQTTGIADSSYFGPENEFFIFDDVRWTADTRGASYKVDSEESSWNSEKVYENRDIGRRPGMKNGFPVPPVDSLQDIRSAMCLTLEEMGLTTEVHRHEAATAGQGKIGVRFNTLVKKADDVLTLKYVVMNVAHAFGKTATFMPKPLVGEQGNGMHVHQSLSKEGNNVFAGDLYGGLSETALHYIGGVIKHARAINAFANASTNSYKRLVPGFGAPICLAYSARHRSAAVRIPHVSSPKSRRLEIRFPDSTANPYFAFSAMLMAGLDGIQNKIHPGNAMDKDLFDLPPEEEKAISTVCFSFEQALDALDSDREFLRAGGVFSDDAIDAYIELKTEEVNRLRMSTHPVEFDMYYSL